MKLLAIFAPLALAATIPTEPTDWPASLEVEATNGNASTKLEIIIRNKSPKAFNILKAGSIIDENRLETVFVRPKSPCGYQFAFSLLDPSDIDSRDESEFQPMPAYGNITATIDLLDLRRKYRVCGKSSSALSIDATFHVAEAGSTTLVHEIPFKMDPVLISFEKLPPLPEAFEERAYNCSPEFLSLMKEGILNYPAHVYLCTRAFFLPMLPDLNEVTSLTHTIIHEMTHIGFVGNTRDHRYGLAGATRFRDTSLAVNNADSYALFSDAVYLKEDGLNQTKVDDIGKRFEAGSRYDFSKLENVTRSEFQSLTPAARIERFGFEF
ncbi:hypothetical protein MY4038_010121 [Beauveria bassiana]